MEKMEQEEEPEEFLDPITLAMMEDAMMTPCGHSFSRASITTWLRQNHPSCPVCKAKLQESQLLPNYALRSAIERWASKRQGNGSTSKPAASSLPLPNNDMYDACPDPVKGSATSTQGSSLEIDADADAPAPSAPPMPDLPNQTGEGCLRGVTRQARESPQGCLVFTCEGPVYCCDQAHQCEDGTACPDPYPWYTMTVKLLCVFSYGRGSTYTRRTWASVLFPLLAIALVALLAWDYCFLIVFWVAALFVISPVWLIVRAPITMLFPLQYERYIQPSCWDKTFGCNG